MRHFDKLVDHSVLSQLVMTVWCSVKLLLVAEESLKRVEKLLMTSDHVGLEMALLIGRIVAVGATKRTHLVALEPLMSAKIRLVFEYFAASRTRVAEFSYN